MLIFIGRAHVFLKNGQSGSCVIYRGGSTRALHWFNPGQSMPDIWLKVQWKSNYVCEQHVLHDTNSTTWLTIIKHCCRFPFVVGKIMFEVKFRDQVEQLERCVPYKPTGSTLEKLRLTVHRTFVKPRAALASVVRRHLSADGREVDLSWKWGIGAEWAVKDE